MKWILLVGSLFFSSAAFGSSSFAVDQHYFSTRAMGMGGAFAAVADDHSAIFYNPAALARRKDGVMHFNLGAGVSDNYLDFIDDLDSVDSNASDEVQQYVNIIEKYYGESFYSRVPFLGAYWMRPNWGIAILPVDTTIDIKIHRGLGPGLSVNAYLDTTFAYAYAKNFKWKGDFSVGATVKAIHRIHYSDFIIAAQLAEDNEIFKTELANEGLTVDADIGVLYSPDLGRKKKLWYRLVPENIAFVVRNIADYGFSTNLNVIDDNSGEPPILQRRIDVGGKWNLPDFWVFDPRLAIDFRDMLHDNWSLEKGLHAGFEVYWKVASWWKGHWSVGLNQTYLTAGFGGKLGIFQLDLATWGEETGTSSNPVESRRYMLEMSIDF